MNVPFLNEHGRENCCMDTTPIAARLSAIASSVNALKVLQNLTFEEFTGLWDFVGFCPVGAWSCTRPLWATTRVRPYKSYQPPEFPKNRIY